MAHEPPKKKRKVMDTWEGDVRRRLRISDRENPQVNIWTLHAFPSESLCHKKVFRSLSELLLLESALVIDGQLHRITEIEFYFKSKLHPDGFSNQIICRVLFSSGAPFWSVKRNEENILKTFGVHFRERTWRIFDLHKSMKFGVQHARECERQMFCE